MFKQSIGSPDIVKIEHNSIVLMFSGGLDSTAALHQLIHDEKYKEFNIHVHHIRLINKCNRYNNELRAVNNILKFYKKIRDISVSTSFIEIPIIFRHMLSDNYIYKFIGGYFASSDDVYGVAYGVTKTDRERPGTSHLDIGFNIQKSFSEKEGIYPVNHLTKEECYYLIPSTIRGLTFSCRIPIKGQPCGACTPCSELKSFNSE